MDGVYNYSRKLCTHMMMIVFVAATAAATAVNPSALITDFLISLIINAIAQLVVRSG